LTSAWKDESYTKGPISKVMVVGVAKEADTRVLFENTFVELFAQYGVEAVSSAAAMPDDPELDKDEVKAKAEKLGIESVFVTHLAATDNEEVYSAPVEVPASDRFSAYYAQVHGQTPARETLGDREYVFLEPVKK
jgi:cyanate lyase